ncbi:hypothetical protein QTG56_17040 [Rossellomorea sp. AcN35-11]|nr:hypothetical protein [Rossellomorea aquimaris]WJV28738.1 hypothetical protein QTG56_17040 [Rossellomorea sp. AcN35-11]
MFIYCFVATFVGPIYSSDTDDGKIEIWFPVGFTVAVLYLLGNERGESVKWKAAFLGVIIGIIQAVKQNWSIL